MKLIAQLFLVVASLSCVLLSRANAQTLKDQYDNQRYSNVRTIPGCETLNNASTCSTAIRRLKIEATTVEQIQIVRSNGCDYVYIKLVHDPMIQYTPLCRLRLGP